MSALIRLTTVCLSLSAWALLAAAPVDYTQRIGGARPAIAQYPVEYTVPTRESVKATLDRMYGSIEANTSLRVFDNSAGVELLAPDLDHLSPTAVVDGRYPPMNRWDYPNGVILTAFHRIYEATGDQRYVAYTTDFYDFIFTWMPYFRALEEQTGQRNDFSRMIHMSALDHCGAITAALIRTEIYEADPRYREWIHEVEAYILERQFRLDDGTLARERPQPRAVWTDDMYMSIPFLAQMGRLTGDERYWHEGVKQVLQLSGYLFHESEGLYDHGWSENTAGYDPRFYWGRANGWAALAMVELLAELPEGFAGRDEVLHLYRQQMRRLVELQDGSGLWHNMLDHNETYLETSASAMFVAALARGVNEGWLSPVFAPPAITGWNAVARRVLPNGQVEGICEGTTYAHEQSYYTYRGAGSDTNFIGTVLYAGSEMLRLLDNPQLKIDAPRPNAVNSALQVKRVE